MVMMNCSLDDNLSLKDDNSSNLMERFIDGKNNSSSDAMYFTDGTNYTCWDYWRNDYYPYVIRESYPVYLQERAKDKGKQAFEIIKILKDKKLVQLRTVGNFIDLMDELIKIL